MARRETRTCLTMLAAVLIVLGTSFQAQAGQIVLTLTSPATALCGTAPCLVASGTDQSNATIMAAISAVYPGLADLVLYKATQADGSEEGAFAAQYGTVFANTLLPDADATISLVGGSAIHGSPVYALIKDGKLPKTADATTWYLYNLTGWNGTDDIVFTGFFEGNQGKISHVGLYGTDVPQVPDGGSVAILLGIGLMALAAFARFLR